MRKSEKPTFQLPKVSRLPTTLPRHRPDFRTGLNFFVSVTGSAFSEVRKSESESAFFLLSKQALLVPETKI